MRLAKYVFTTAGIWGIVVLDPLYWLFDITGRRYAPPADYPHFFYGFLSVAMAWQIAFLVIGSNPARFRPLMIAAILEKLGYVGTLTVMYVNGRIPAADTGPVVPDRPFHRGIRENQSAGSDLAPLAFRAGGWPDLEVLINRRQSRTPVF